MPPRRISLDLQEELLTREESGMGYQIAEIRSDLVTASFLILNAEVAFQLPEFFSGRIPFWTDFREYMGQDDMRWLHGTVGPESAAPESTTTEELSELRGALLHVLTHGSYRSVTDSGETFMRFSAYQRDRRINSDGSVVSDTYVTTATDKPLVPSGLAAVSRYALPNLSPAVYTFTLFPPQGIDIRCGTVSPNFGHAGGGVEVLFNGPLPAGTAKGPSVIPER